MSELDPADFDDEIEETEPVTPGPSPYDSADFDPEAPQDEETPDA